MSILMLIAGLAKFYNYMYLKCISNYRNKENKTNIPLSRDQIRCHIGRLKAQKTMLIALKSAPIGPEVQKAIEDAKQSSNTADQELQRIAIKAERDRQKCLAKRGCSLLHNAIRCSDFSNSSDSLSDLIDRTARIHSYTEGFSSQFNPTIQNVIYDQAIVHMDTLIEEYTKAMDKADVCVSELAQKAMETNKQLGSPWKRFEYDSSMKYQNSDAYSSYRSSQSVRGSKLWSVSTSSTITAALKNFSMQMNSAKIVVNGELLRVTIQRPWFRPSLFRSDQYSIVSNFVLVKHSILHPCIIIVHR